MLPPSFRPLVPKLSSVVRSKPLHRRTFLALKDHKFTGRATASGDGWNGIVTSNEGGGVAPLDLKMSVPEVLGGLGKGHNPEQLVAAGYASCFLGSLQLMASNAGKGKLAEDAKVHVSVHMGTPTNMQGYGFEVEIEVEGFSDESVIENAHAFCPVSRTMAHGARVTVKKK